MMKKRPVNEMLDLITERSPYLVNSTPYQTITAILDKSAISYVEKLEVKENLRVLCAVSGLSYDRLIRKVCR